MLAGYADQVKALRARNYQENLALLVIIDGDELGVDGRKGELDARLRAANIAVRQDPERVAVLTPCRNIETWYVHFSFPERRPLDERSDYKASPEMRELAGSLASAGQAVAQGLAGPARGDDPAAVAAARSELKRLA